MANIKQQNATYPGAQADGMGASAKFMANIGISLNINIFSMNSFRWLHFETYQRRSFLSAMLHPWAEAPVR